MNIRRTGGARFMLQLGAANPQHEKRRPVLRSALFSSAAASGVHGIEEFRIALRVPELVEQEVDRIHGAHRIEDAAQIGRASCRERV